MIKHFQDILLEKLQRFLNNDGSGRSLSGDSVGFDSSSSEDWSANESADESTTKSGGRLMSDRRLKAYTFARRAKMVQSQSKA